MSEPIRMQTQCPKCWEWCYPSEGCKRCATPKATMDNREKLARHLWSHENRPMLNDGSGAWVWEVQKGRLLRLSDEIIALLDLPPKPEGKEA